MAEDQELSVASNVLYVLRQVFDGHGTAGR